MKRIFFLICLVLVLSNNPLMAKSKISKISSSVYQINLGVVNCFLIEDAIGLTLVDTGYEGDDVKIYNALLEIGKTPSDIKQIILTHLHPDHSGSAALIQNKLNIPVYVSEADGVLLSNGFSMRANTKTTKGFFNSILKKLFVKDIQKVIEIKNLNYLTDNNLTSFNKEIEIHLTAGHSEGHLVLLIKKDKLLIAGDLCANNVGLSYSIVNENEANCLGSIKNLQTLDFDKTCFGHGATILKDAKSKFFKKFGN